MTSLVIQTSFLGDMVLTTPLIAYLAERGPVDVVSTPAAAALLANHPHVRERIVYDKRGADSGVGGFFRMASRLRGGRYATAYLAQGSVRSGALAAAAGIRDRVGFSSSAGRAFYTTRVAPIDNVHHAARLLSLGTRDPMLAASRPLRPSLFPGAAEREAVDALLGPASSQRIVAVAPGSVWATKRWPHFPALAAALRNDARVVVVGAEADRGLAAEILGTTPDAIDATGKLSLLASAELIRRSAVLVTNDSSPLHLASAMNTPTVAVFGPTVPEFGFGPLSEQSATAGLSGLPCRPCDRHGPQRCPLGHWRCMRDLDVPTVLGLARLVIERSAPARQNGQN